MSLRHKKVKGISDAQIEKVMKSPKVKAGVDAKAEKVQTFWQSIAPVFNPQDPREHRKVPRKGQAGDYAKSIAITDISDENGARDRVEPTDFKAKWIEFGTKHMPKYAPKAKVKAKFK